MVEEAEGGDTLAMAALGVMYVLGQQCAPKRNLTCMWRGSTRGAAVAQNA